MKTAEEVVILVDERGKRIHKGLLAKHTLCPCLTFHSVQVDHFNKNEKVVYYYCCLYGPGVRAQSLVIAGQVFYQQATFIIIRIILVNVCRVATV